MKWGRLLAGAVLAATAMLPRHAAWVCALAAIIVLGVPHGALDGELARDWLRPHYRRSWFLVFALPYMTLSAGVLVAWRLAPLWTLAVFLAGSVWHFGSEDAGSGRLVERLARGGLPVALPVLVHPAATAMVFGPVAMVPMQQPPAWLLAGAFCWLAVAILSMSQAAARGQVGALRAPAWSALAFLVLPPLTAFATYFVCVHAPVHVAALIRDAGRGIRVRDARSAAVLSLPITILTLLIGVALWRLYPGAAPERLLCLTVQGLAALTLPHMVLDHVVQARICSRFSSSVFSTSAPTMVPQRQSPWAVRSMP